jgi:hypothetical protein
MDRKLYKIPFKIESTPNWVCPKCSIGILKIKKGTYFNEELSNSKKSRSHDDWDPQWIQQTYSCLLQCTNDKCKEVVSNSGSGSVDWDLGVDDQGNAEQVYDNFFTPLYFYPHLKLIPIPGDTPEKVSNLLNESFKLFFSSPAAASNHVRAAIEELLTDLKVKRYYVHSKGMRKSISLHQRIELLPTKYNGLKELFFAIKWLGNAGSHSGDSVSNDDVMDAYELVEHILKEVYDNKEIALKALAKKVNKAKGPKK